MPIERSKHPGPEAEDEGSGLLAVRVAGALGRCGIGGTQRPGRRVLGLGRGAMLGVFGALCMVSDPSRGVEAVAGKPEAEHWAFRVVERPVVPAVSHPEAMRSPVDRFVQARAAQEGLALGPEADRFTRIRRVAFLVTGLPPTPEAIEAFVADRTPGAYGRMVERYLGSERFGERWGKLWLDAAGYADSNGYFNADTDRPLAYRYRDWVIRAVGRDLPFDRFVREQIAGDELAGWRPGDPVTPRVVESLEATHFLRNGQDGSGESDGNPDEVRADRYYALESAMQIVGSSLLGVTLQCAKCHEHKFEPIRQEDYYAFQAFLYPAFHVEKWVKPNDRVVTAALPGEAEAWEKRERELDARKRAVLDEFREWYVRHRPPGKVLFEDGFDDGPTWTNRWSNRAPGDQAAGGAPPVSFDPEVAPSASVAQGRLRIREGGGSGDRWLSTEASFPWRPARTGAWIQVTFDLKSLRWGADGKPAERVGYFVATHDFDDSSDVSGGNILIDGHPGGASQVQVDYPGADARGRGEVGSIGYEAGRSYGIRLTRESPEDVVLEHVVDGVPEGKKLTLKADEVTEGGFGFEYCCGRSFEVDDVRVETSDWADEDWRKRDGEFRSVLGARRSKVDAALKEIAAARTSAPGKIAWVSDVVGERPSVPLLKRGNPKTPGEPVEPSFPAFLGRAVLGATGVPGTEGGRRGTTGLRRAWAEWLTEPGTRAASLLARVTVNRIWQGYFGVGLVATPDNLGRSGARPTHPELLEWLASELMESGWSTKSVHRAILNSATFQQRSEGSSVARERDPSNAWLTRFPLRRLDAESIRDAMLAASGRLSGKAGGPYVPTSRRADGEVVVDEAHPEAGARSVFLQQRRTQVATMLGLFDAPSVVFNCTRRASTTMPLQSLGLLNSEFALARGRDLAERVLREAGTGEVARIRRAFLLAAGREPDGEEREIALEFIRTQRGRYGVDASGDRRVWDDFCQSMFASNAFLYLE